MECPAKRKLEKFIIREGLNPPISGDLNENEVDDTMEYHFSNFRFAGHSMT